MLVRIIKCARVRRRKRRANRPKRHSAPAKQLVVHLRKQPRQRLSCILSGSDSMSEKEKNAANEVSLMHARTPARARTHAHTHTRNSSHPAIVDCYCFVPPPRCIVYFKFKHAHTHTHTCTHRGKEGESGFRSFLQGVTKRAKSVQVERQEPLVLAP